MLTQSLMLSNSPSQCHPWPIHVRPIRDQRMGPTDLFAYVKLPRAELGECVKVVTKPGFTCQSNSVCGLWLGACLKCICSGPVPDLAGQNQGLGSTHLCFNKSSRWAWYTLQCDQCENCYTPKYPMTSLLSLVNYIFGFYIDRLDIFHFQDHVRCVQVTEIQTILAKILCNRH